MEMTLLIYNQRINGAHFHVFTVENFYPRKSSIGQNASIGRLIEQVCH
jgi:hypothetical protein